MHLLAEQSQVLGDGLYGMVQGQDQRWEERICINEATLFFGTDFAPSADQGAKKPADFRPGQAGSLVINGDVDAIRWVIRNGRIIQMDVEHRSQRLAVTQG